MQTTELTQLPNERLFEEIKSCIGTEYTNESRMVQFISEADRRQLFRDYGCKSLFELLTQRLGLSAGSAQYRIAAARLLRVVPFIKEGLACGELGLVQLNLVYKAVRLRKNKKTRFLRICKKN